MDADHLRRLFDAGRSFREAFDEACCSDTAFAVEAFELWTTWGTKNAVREARADIAVVRVSPHHDRSAGSTMMAYPISASKDAVCWLLRDEWAGLPPGTWVRDGRSVWLVPNTNLEETAR